MGWVGVVIIYDAQHGQRLFIPHASREDPNEQASPCTLI